MQFYAYIHDTHVFFQWTCLHLQAWPWRLVADWGWSNGESRRSFPIWVQLRWGPRGMVKKCCEWGLSLDILIYCMILGRRKLLQSVSWHQCFVSYLWTCLMWMEMKCLAKTWACSNEIYRAFTDSSRLQPHLLTISVLCSQESCQLEVSHFTQIDWTLDTGSCNDINLCLGEPNTCLRSLG